MKNLFMKGWLVAVGCLAVAAFVSCSDDDDKKKDEPRGTISVDVSELMFTCGDYYSQTVPVKAENVTWSAVSDASWAHAAVSSDINGVSALTVSVDRNTGAARTTTIVLGGKNADPVSITVKQEKAFSSDIIGTYKPLLVDYNGQQKGDFFLNSAWTTGVGPDLPISLPGMEGLNQWPVLVDQILVPMIGGYYKSGLNSFTFRDDGTLAATYRAASGDFMSGLEFAESISTYPTEATMKVLPPEALRYYTAGGKVYFSIDKAYLNKMGVQLGIDNLCAVIDLMVGQYSGLTLVSTDEFYALPFKYSVSGDVMTLYIDREMMLPYKPLLIDVVPLLLKLVDAETLAGLGLDAENPKPVTDFIEALFTTSTKLDLGVRLTK